MMACRVGVAAALVLVPVTLIGSAIDLDVTPQDVDRALTIARLQDRERASFHAPYIKHVNSATVERVEVVTEFRRIVLTAEEQALKGDRAFGYSVTRAEKANAPWKGRLAMTARLRFHPQNTYVAVPAADIVLQGAAADVIGVLRNPILSLPSSQPGDRLPILGAIVETVFNAVTLGQGTREFIVRLEERELTRVTFDLGALQ
jgi:hypothetical protein